MHLALQLVIARLEGGGIGGESRRQAEQLEVVLIQFISGSGIEKRGIRPFSAQRGGPR